MRGIAKCIPDVVPRLLLLNFGSAVGGFGENLPLIRKEHKYNSAQNGGSYSYLLSPVCCVTLDVQLLGRWFDMADVTRP